MKKNFLKKKVYPERSRKVFVGLSGGVDSAVSAALLKQRGYDVTGVFIKVWQPDFLECSWREERRDAMRVAIHLDIPFLFLDFSEEYKRGVADLMLAEYKAGRTPNPDVLCNKEIKFGAFWDKAREMGADYIATGHYAQKQKNEKEEYILSEGEDKDKDQSYFLWTMPRTHLEEVLFPLGGMQKSEVRALAKKFRLPVSEKKDSQGLCFLGEVSMEEFLSHFIPVKVGKVLNTEGEVIGSHKGALLYTLGQRHGFSVREKGPDDSAFYVVVKDMRTNTIVVSNDAQEISSFSPKKALLSNVNWITEPENSDLTARIRYKGKKVRVNLFTEKSKLGVEFAEPQSGLSLGQSIVFYKGSECLGGAIMDKIEA